MTSSQKGCWYEIWFHECPVCGHSKTYRERRHTVKPAAWEDRHHHEVDYDYCLE